MYCTALVGALFSRRSALLEIRSFCSRGRRISLSISFPQPLSFLRELLFATFCSRTLPFISATSFPASEIR